jgi:hypothetical protein
LGAAASAGAATAERGRQTTSLPTTAPVAVHGVADDGTELTARGAEE